MDEMIAKPVVGFGLSDEAVSHLRKLASEQPGAGGGLRVAIRGGGCSGLMYVMEWAPQPKEKDKVFERDGVQVFVDSKSFLYLKGSELHYESSLLASGFKVRNPNTKSACGCGESFSI